MAPTPKSVINETANRVNLAKSWLLTLDRNQIETSVNTATLELLLRTIIEWGEPESNEQIEMTAEQLHEAHKQRVAAAFEAEQGRR